MVGFASRGSYPLRCQVFWLMRYSWCGSTWHTWSDKTGFISTAATRLVSVDVASDDGNWVLMRTSGIVRSETVVFGRGLGKATTGLAAWVAGTEPLPLVELRSHYYCCLCNGFAQLELADSQRYCYQLDDWCSWTDL